MVAAWYFSGLSFNGRCYHKRHGWAWHSELPEIHRCVESVRSEGWDRIAGGQGFEWPAYAKASADRAWIEARLLDLRLAAQSRLLATGRLLD
jgi:hypothetical protein